MPSLPRRVFRATIFSMSTVADPTTHMFECKARIDPRDPAFSHLVLWRDANRDGASDGELVSLAAEGIVTLPVAYTTSSARDPFGNALAQQGEFQRTNGSGRMIDVWFRLRR